MRLDDPGWGEYVPRPEEHGKESAGKEPPTGGSPPTSGPPSKPPSAPWWRGPFGIVVGLGLAAVVAVIVVVMQPDPGPQGGGETETTVITDTTGVTGGTQPTGGENQTPPTETIQSRTEQYLEQANAICSQHRPGIVNALNAFAASGDVSGLLPPLQALFSDLQGLGAPAAPGTETYLADLDLLIRQVQEGAGQNVQIGLTAMGTSSIEAGLQSCPPN